MISLGLSLSESFLVVGIDCRVLVNSSPSGSISLILACHVPSPFLGGLFQFIGLLIKSSDSHMLLLRFMGGFGAAIHPELGRGLYDSLFPMRGSNMSITALAVARNPLPTSKGVSCAFFHFRFSRKSFNSFSFPMWTSTSLTIPTGLLLLGQMLTHFCLVLSSPRIYPAGRYRLERELGLQEPVGLFGMFSSRDVFLDSIVEVDGVRRCSGDPIVGKNEQTKLGKYSVWFLTVLLALRTVVEGMVSPKLFCSGLKVYHLPPASSVASEQDELPSSIGLDFQARLDGGRMYSGHLEAKAKGRCHDEGLFVVSPLNESMLQIEILHDVVGTSGYHCGVLRSFPVERIEQGNE
ncbi:hypothetical protein Tco_0403521 [Tanacetum coccineum]